MAHTIAQPGLHAHSWNPDDDLMKRFLISRSMNGGGWLGLASFHDYTAALDDMIDRTYDDTEHAYKLIDQFSNECKVVIEPRNFNND